MGGGLGGGKRGLKGGDGGFGGGGGGGRNSVGGWRFENHHEYDMQQSEFLRGCQDWWVLWVFKGIFMGF